MEAFLDLLEKGTQKFQQFYEEDKPAYLFSVRVDSIEAQPDKLDSSRLKRGKAKLTVKERSKKSHFMAIVEFRGRTLILSREDGSCSVGEVGKRLDLEFSKKYRKESLKLDRILEGGRVLHYTVANPEHFLDFLHLLHIVPALDIYSQQGEHVMQRLLEWAKERKNAKVP